MPFIRFPRWMSQDVEEGGALTFGANGKAAFLRRPVAAPALATSPGQVGQMTSDANFVYVCTAPNTWKRVAIATF